MSGVTDTVAQILRRHHNTARTSAADLEAEAAEIVAAVTEHIADRFDDLAAVAEIADRENRNIDAHLAWESAARITRRTANPTEVPAP